MHAGRTPLWSRRPLIAVAIGLPVVEAATLLACGIGGGMSLAGQISALGPFGTFHDLRWLFVFHDSAATFALGLAVLVGFRSVLTAAMVRLSWPRAVPAPSSVRLLADAAVATVVAVLALAPWVTLLFGAAVVPLSWVFLGSFPPALLTIVLLHHGGVTRDWWRRLPPLRSLGWAVVAFAGLTVGGLALAGRSGPGVLPVVALIGAFNAWVWERAVAAVVLRVPAARRRPAPATIVALVGLLVTVVGGSRLGFGLFADADEPVTVAVPTVPGRSVVVVPGFAADCCNDAAGFGAGLAPLNVVQFSYSGLDEKGRPVPHAGDATDGDLRALADSLDRQVEALAARTGGPVDVIAESEGTLIASIFLDRHPGAPVEHVALLSPIVGAGRVGFPEPGAEGRGVVAGYQLRAMVAVVDGLTDLELSADGPLSTSVRSGPPVSTLTDRDHVEELVVVPLADAVMGGASPVAEVPVVVVVDFHGGLRARPDVQRLIVAWLHGDEIRGSDVLASLERIIAAGAAAWWVPASH
jgi:hypothetical protein